MTRSNLNKNVHARVQNRLRHRGLTGLARGEWDFVRASIDGGIVAGDSPKEIASRAVRWILDAREFSARDEALDLLAELAQEPIAHEPIDDATRIFAQVA